MDYKGLERRTCIRFEIPGATVNYKKKKLISYSRTYEEEFCPVMDISRGGLRFLSQQKIKINQELILAISIPGERAPLIMKGEVRWSSPNPGKSYRYQIGVQFHPYGEKKNHNYPGNLVKIIALEQKFVPEEELEKFKEQEEKKQ
ncbi:MAG: PilZ domain-containing protein [Candidatus Aminicenantes bacterium]|nr:MAG: PilZ domain-containing protein [Candidatus Aminicenantes bacterium]